MMLGVVLISGLRESSSALRLGGNVTELLGWLALKTLFTTEKIGQVPCLSEKHLETA